MTERFIYFIILVVVLLIIFELSDRAYIRRRAAKGKRKTYLEARHNKELIDGKP